MKILHTSDWHLGKKLDNFSRHHEQVAVLEEIEQIANKNHVDAIVVAGDLFDTFNPPVESVDLFYKALKRMANNGNRAVICIAGNHDSPDRIEAPDPLAKECGIIFSGYPGTHVSPFMLDTGLGVIQSAPGFIELKLPQADYPLRVLLTPYANELRFKTFLGYEDAEQELRVQLARKWTDLANLYCDIRGVNMLVSHLFFAKQGNLIEEEPDDEKPIVHVGGAQIIYTDAIPAKIQYTALGHLHRHHWVDQATCPVVYCGSPVAYSFSEANQAKYVSIVDLEPGKEAKVEKIKLVKGKQLLRKKAQGTEEAIQWLQQNQDALVELTLVTENYLSAAERKSLMAAHDGIISIIPEVKNRLLIDAQTPQIDLTKSMEELFIAYFKSAKGIEPNNDLLLLFKEVLATDKNQ
jgi:exonuclease SbcD